MRGLRYQTFICKLQNIFYHNYLIQFNFLYHASKATKCALSKDTNLIIVASINNH
jgi:hypothetical protein